MPSILFLIRHVILLLCCALLSVAQAQTTRRVLFLGNSYTGYNNLPQLVKDVALSAGDTLIFDKNHPGGYTLDDHTQDVNSTNKIAAGNWDYLVLQGQSREPILQNFRFRSGAQRLQQLMHQSDSCATTLFYMTWGRENGDATYCPTYPQMCTYSSMDSTLQNKYMGIADQLNAEISPVSEVWQYLRKNHPSINLYTSDGSHPSAAGSYAAACSFYTSIFKKDPSNVTFNFTLSATQAATIRNAAKLEVYDSLAQWDFRQPSNARFLFSIGTGNNEVHFQSINGGVNQHYFWDFGDGSTSTQTNPTHTYTTDGTYTVSLTTSLCNIDGVQQDVADTVITFCGHTPLITTSKAFICNYDTLFSTPGDAHQWYSGGQLIPETRSFLPNYKQYYVGAYTVKTTINGCTELSKPFVANPPWSGYYFDATAGGNPCEGDTAVVALLSASGFSGSEIVRWYKDGVLLPANNDQDTLLVSIPGKYEGKVINPSGDCPYDTTSTGVIDYTCNQIGIQKVLEPLQIYAYPNPTSGKLRLTGSPAFYGRKISFYSATGKLMCTKQFSTSMSVDMTFFPKGVYHIIVEGEAPKAIKVIKL